MPNFSSIAGLEVAEKFVVVGGGGVKGFLNNVKKTSVFLHGGFP